MGSGTARKDTAQEVHSHRNVKHLMVLESEEQCSVLKLCTQQISMSPFLCNYQQKGKTQTYNFSSKVEFCKNAHFKYRGNLRFSNGTEGPDEQTSRLKKKNNNKQNKPG